MENKKFELELGGRKLIANFRNMVEQSNGSLLLQYGETVVLATAVMASEEKEGMGFFPLTVDYEERFYARGEIMGSRYVRREGRPSNEAICNARLIDRSIRPLFPDDFQRETQVIVTVLSWDNQNDPAVLGLLAASTALSVSDIPWEGPIAAVRVGHVDNKLVLNPTYEELDKSDLNIIFSVIQKDGELLINMLEGSFEEIEEDLLVQAYEFAKPHLQKIVDFENQIQKELGKEKLTLKTQSKNPSLEQEVQKILSGRLEQVFYQPKSEGRKEEMNELRDKIMDFVKENYPEEEDYAKDILDEEIKKLVQKKILQQGERLDGRGMDEIRPLACEAGTLPRSHGSGFFRRGLTKSLSILTLGAPGDVKLLEGMEVVGEKRFFHHYNFPPYSVGEVRRLRGPGRREIGHGTLAEKALSPVIPSSEEFPYTIRIVTEILSSNGSTSMASVCSSSLALMDAGVPIKAPVAGIAIGLMTDSKGGYKLLTDIQGPEDHYGKMDFKLAGTRNGATALQMDIKINGITEEIFKEALQRGKKARAQILDKIAEVLEGPRPNLSPYAPRILTLRIDPSKIRQVIGPGGKVINEIIDECGVTIDVEDTGEIFITAEKEGPAKKALNWIKNITREIKVGETFQGKVNRILDFGAFVELTPGQDGLIHISKLAPHHVDKVEDVVKVGDVVPVKVINIDEQGRIDLTLLHDKHSQKNHGRKKSRQRR
ncbi:MAG: polyribonucleotide nucleotidyltransferase [Candidatus Nealsonbacteria bacterium]|nr:polyribonucleotide nucleotidyltransferase [Candidatus Nealsonbacteria bacterium]